MTTYEYAAEFLPLDWNLCPREAGIIGSLADNECVHGKLPTDQVVRRGHLQLFEGHQFCACWGRLLPCEATNG